MSYKDTRSAYHNCEKMIFDGVGEFGVPQMSPVEIDLNDLETIGFNYAIGDKHPENKIIHFYLDDYQFIRVWKDVIFVKGTDDKYIDMICEYNENADHDDCPDSLASLIRAIGEKKSYDSSIFL